MKPVLFVSGLGKELERVENLKVLYDAYQGEKQFIPVSSPNYYKEITSNKYSLRIVDTFPTEHNLPTILVWHAIQGGKYIGLDEKTTYYKKEYANCIDYVISAGGGFGKIMWNQCTAVPLNKILPLGMPRTDRYIGKNKGDGNTILKDKRSYLYVPTFRAHKEPAIPVTDWKWLDENLSDDELFVIKPHPQGQKLTTNHYKHIIETDKMEPSVNYLYDADIIITDYSSIIFDGYLLNKPSVLFEKQTGYPEIRGMYMQYPREYSSKYATNEKELLEILRSTNTLTNIEQECLQKVANKCDGHSCERICNLINTLR